jgi:glycosyltransferase involved in cell wall biosynthesis
VKIAWLHGDLSRCGADIEWSRRLYGRFDRIVACSEGTRRAFLGCLPEYADKTLTIRNCNDYAAIRTLAGEGEPVAKGVFHVVTVARLSEEKGIERALRAVSFVKEQGHLVHYHIVGDGKRREALERLCEQLGLTDELTFYGNRRNPYPYIKSADLFLLTSYHEAAPMVLDEAACLGVPVLTTKTTSTDEMVHACGSGFVAEQAQQSINEWLLYLTENAQELQKVRATLAARTFDNSESIARFETLINE